MHKVCLKYSRDGYGWTVTRKWGDERRTFFVVSAEDMVAMEAELFTYNHSVFTLTRVNWEYREFVGTFEYCLKRAGFLEFDIPMLEAVMGLTEFYEDHDGLGKLYAEYLEAKDKFDRERGWK